MRRFLIATFAAILTAASAASAAYEPAYIVVDADNGSVLLESHSDQPWFPASVTKLMTAYLAFQALQSGRLKLTSPVRVSQNAVNQPPSKMGYKAGTILNLDNALKMMLVKSANDIAVAVAETVGGNEGDFVAMMNAEAIRLGMYATHFNNPHGLFDAGQVTTARDLAVLSRAVMLEYPQFGDYFRIPAIKAGKKILRSPNGLLEHYRGTTGLKTGFICASGFNVAASAERNGRHLIAVVLGAETALQRTEMSAQLLNKGFASWGGPLKPKLATFNVGPAPGEPANLREFICGKKTQGESDGTVDTQQANLSVNSALVPRFVLMDPVPVVTGQADPPPGAVGGSMPADMPMPRLRPRTAANATALPSEPLQLFIVDPN